MPCCFPEFFDHDNLGTKAINCPHRPFRLAPLVSCGPPAHSCPQPSCRTSDTGIYPASVCISRVVSMAWCGTSCIAPAPQDFWPAVALLDASSVTTASLVRSHNHINASRQHPSVIRRGCKQQFVRAICLIRCRLDCAARPLAFCAGLAINDALAAWRSH